MQKGKKQLKRLAALIMAFAMVLGFSVNASAAISADSYRTLEERTDKLFDFGAFRDGGAQKGLVDWSGQVGRVTAGKLGTYNYALGSWYTLDGIKVTDSDLLDKLNRDPADVIWVWDGSSGYLDGASQPGLRAPVITEDEAIRKSKTEALIGFVSDTIGTYRYLADPTNSLTSVDVSDLTGEGSMVDDYNEVTIDGFTPGAPGKLFIMWLNSRGVETTIKEYSINDKPQAGLLRVKIGKGSGFDSTKIISPPVTPGLNYAYMLIDSADPSDLRDRPLLDDPAKAYTPEANGYRLVAEGEDIFVRTNDKYIAIAELSDLNKFATFACLELTDTNTKRRPKELDVRDVEMGTATGTKATITHDDKDEDAGIEYWYKVEDRTIAESIVNGMDRGDTIADYTKAKVKKGKEDNSRIIDNIKTSKYDDVGKKIIIVGLDKSGKVYSLGLSEILMPTMMKVPVEELTGWSARKGTEPQETIITYTAGGLNLAISKLKTDDEVPTPEYGTYIVGAGSVTEEIERLGGEVIVPFKSGNSAYVDVDNEISVGLYELDSSGRVIKFAPLKLNYDNVKIPANKFITRLQQIPVKGDNMIVTIETLEQTQADKYSDVYSLLYPETVYAYKFFTKASYPTRPDKGSSAVGYIEYRVGETINKNNRDATDHLVFIEYYIDPEDNQRKILAWDDLDGSVDVDFTLELTPYLRENDNVEVDDVIGTFIPDTYVYELVAGDSDDDNDKFQILGNELVVIDNALTEGTYSIRVEATDVGIGSKKVQEFADYIVVAAEDWIFFDSWANTGGLAPPWERNLYVLVIGGAGDNYDVKYVVDETDPTTDVILSWLDDAYDGSLYYVTVPGIADGDAPANPGNTSNTGMIPAYNDNVRVTAK